MKLAERVRFAAAVPLAMGWLIGAPIQAQAAAVTFGFSGNFTTILNMPGLPSAFTGSLTFDDSTAGVPDGGFSYYTDYVGAVTSFSLNIGAETYTASSGNVTVGSIVAGAPNDTVIFDTILPTGPRGTLRANFNFAELIGSVLTDNALPSAAELSQFLTGGDGHAQLYFYLLPFSTGGYAFVQLPAPPAPPPAATPLPAAALLYATGLGACGALLGWRKKRKGAAARATTA